MDRAGQGRAGRGVTLSFAKYLSTCMLATYFHCYNTELYNICYVLGSHDQPFACCCCILATSASRPHSANVSHSSMTFEFRNFCNLGSLWRFKWP